MVLFSIAVILLVLLVILDYWKKRYWISATKNFDGPFAWPIIGNALLFRCKNDDILQNVSDILVHKSPFRLWMGPELIVGSDIPRHVEVRAFPFAFRYINSRLPESVILC